MSKTYTPEQVVGMLKNVFVMGELTGFLDSLSMHEGVPEETRKYAAEKVTELRQIIRDVEDAPLS